MSVVDGGFQRVAENFQNGYEDDKALQAALQNGHAAVIAEIERRSEHREETIEERVIDQDFEVYEPSAQIHFQLGSDSRRRKSGNSESNRLFRSDIQSNLQQYSRSNGSLKGVVNEEDDLENCIHVVDDSLIREKEHVPEPADMTVRVPTVHLYEKFEKETAKTDARSRRGQLGDEGAIEMPREPSPEPEIPEPEPEPEVNLYTCAACEGYIQGRCITAMRRKFHPEHFVCSFCLKQLNKGTFKEKSEKPYCHTCFYRLFG